MIVSPGWILCGEANDGVDDFLSDAWPTGLLFVARVKLLRDQFPVPLPDRVWRGDVGQLAESLAACRVSLHRQHATLVVIQERPF